MKNVNTLLSEAASLLNETQKYYYNDKEISKEEFLKLEDSDKIKSYKTANNKTIDKIRKEKGLPPKDRTKDENKPQNESIDKLISIVETVEFNMIYESLTEATTEEDVAKKENKLKVAKDTIVKAVKKIIEILKEKLSNLITIIRQKFESLKTSELTVTKETEVLDVKVDSIINDEKYDPYEYTMNKVYKVGDKVKKNKITKEIASFQKGLEKVSSQIQSFEKSNDTDNDIVDRCKIVVGILEKAISTHSQLINNTEENKEEK